MTEPRRGQKKTILTVGLSPDDAYWLSRIDRPERFCFRSIGRFAEADNPELCKPRRFVADAIAEIKRRNMRPDGIVGFDDYPASLLALAISNRLGLPGPRLESALLCSHKAWSRLLQKEIVPQSVPAFQVVDPTRRYRPSDLELRFPFWLKPVKSSMSYLGFRISRFEDFERACETARRELPRYVAAFDEFMEMSSISVPAGGHGIGANWLIAEELMGGRQCTLEGFGDRGKTIVFAIVDSIRLPNRVSFKRFDYPSGMGKAEISEMSRIAERVMQHVGYDGGLFNIEFFLDRRRDAPMIVEINPRFSPQNSDLYHKVDGVLNHQFVVELAAGLQPSIKSRAGGHRIAASCVLRVGGDRIVRRAPSAADIKRLKKSIPDAHVYLTAKSGDRLSDLAQDMYTFRYGLVHLGADNRRHLKQRLRLALKHLPYVLEPVSQDLRASRRKRQVLQSDQVGSNRPRRREVGHALARDASKRKR